MHSIYTAYLESATLEAFVIRGSPGSDSLDHVVQIAGPAIATSAILKWSKLSLYTFFDIQNDDVGMNTMKHGQRPNFVQAAFLCFEVRKVACNCF